MDEALPSLQVLLEGSLDRVREVGRLLAKVGIGSQTLAPASGNPG